MNNWIDAEIISAPYNEPIDVCYYGVYNNYNNKYGVYYGRKRFGNFA